MQNDIEKQKEEALKINLTIYRNEIWSITDAILQLKDKLLNSKTYLDIKSHKNKLISDPSPEPHEIIAAILNNSSRLHKLFEVSSQRQTETDGQYNFRKERGELLRKFFLVRSKGSKELFKSSVRNSVEHFDERIDEIVNCFIKQDSKIKQKLILYNFSLTTMDNFHPIESVIPIKVWDIQTMNYYMIGHELKRECVNLDKIFKEVENIEKRILDYVNQNFPEDSEERMGPVGIFISNNE